jgi:hypothetical protein
MLNEMLVAEVVPRLRAALRTIPKVGHEDDEEILQDTTLMAAKMMDSAAKEGRTLPPSSVAYYAARAARSGRRSYYSGRADALSPGCQIDGNAKHLSLDEEVATEDGDLPTRHDMFAAPDFGGPEPDPSEEAARNLDWEAFLAEHPGRHRTVVEMLVKGETMRRAGRLCGVGDSRASAIKRRIAADLVEFFGADVVRRLLGGARPRWEADVRALRDRSLSHAHMPRELAPAAF